MPGSPSPKRSKPRREHIPLAPVAYDPTMMPSLGLVRSSRIVRRIARWLCVVMIAVIVLMAFAPWQQSVTGSGTTVAFAPGARQQTIDTPIKGRIVRWGEGIFENALVKKGQVIAEVRDLDEAYASRLNQKLENSEQSVEFAGQQLEAYQDALKMAESIVDTAKNQVQAFESIKLETKDAQKAFVQMAQEKVESQQQQLAEYEAAIPQLEAEFERARTLNEEGNFALQKFQEVEAKLNGTRAKVKKAEIDVAAAESDLAGKKAEARAKIEEAQAKIEYAQAFVGKAETDVSKAGAVVAKAEQELNKARKELIEAETEVARQETQIIKAQFDGYLVQIRPNLQTAVLKAGDPICTIVPDTSDRAVQIWLSGNDAPLVEPGRHVRLQFEGWPAVQFAGWPSVAVGTFGGQVVSVDATDNGKGKFRVLIKPDPSDRPWPQDRFLRQGVRANGWVLLNQVPLWYEVWRRLNGFPPVVSIDEPDEKVKPPKLPK